MSQAARQPTAEAPPAPAAAEGEPTPMQVWTPPPAYRADARAEQRPPAERPALYYACTLVAVLCALGWIAAWVVEGSAAHLILAVVWLATTPLFVQAARRAARDR